MFLPGFFSFWLMYVYVFPTYINNHTHIIYMYRVQGQVFHPYVLKCAPNLCLGLQGWLFPKAYCTVGKADFYSLVMTVDILIRNTWLLGIPLK